MSKKKKKPSKIFKYQPMTIYSLNNLNNNQLWFSKPTNFNDPFDTCFDFDEKSITLEVMKSVYKNNFPFNSSDVKEFLNIQKNIKKGLIKKQRKFFESVGVCCFCKKEDNILMWSHYADQHRGFCLEFNTSDPLFKELKPVSYSEIFPILNHQILTEDDKDTELTKMLHTKYIGWKYEKEWRIVLPDRGDQLVTYQNESLTGIYFGARMKDSDKDLVKSILKNRNNSVKFYQCSLNSSLYKIDISSI